MKKLGLALLLFVLGLAPAQAQPINQYIAAGAFPFQALGYCQLTSLVTAKAITTCSTQTATGTVSGVPSGANIIEICVETQAIRYLDLNRVPTSSVGMPAASGACYQYSSSTIGQLSFIEQTASATVDIYFFNGGRQ